MEEILKNNIHEIHHATNVPDLQTLTLVADWSGKHIYFAKRGWGRLWRWVYDIVELFTGQDYRLQKLQQAIVLTQELYAHQIQVVTEALSQYTNYLQKASNDYPIDEKDYFSARDAIQKWSSSTAPFVKMMQRNLQPRLEGLFRYCLGDSLNKENIAELFAFPAEKMLRACKRVIDLEGLCYGPLPLAPIKKALKGKVLNNLDLKALDKWIKKIERNAISVSSLHYGIKALARLNQKKEEESEGQLDPTSLEKLMEDRGCQVFKAQDLSQVLWRNGLKEGTTLVGPQGEIVLGREINPSGNDDNHFSVYEIVGNPEQVVVVGHNRAVLNLRNLRQHAGNPFGIAPAALEFVSKGGRWALMERLQPLSAKQWTSRDIGEIDEEDRPAADAIVGLLKTFIAKEQTPSLFHPHALMLTQKFELKSLKPIEGRPFDFTAFEEFIKECAAENRTLYRYFMQSSGLSDSSTARFYHECLKNALKGDLTAAEDLGNIFRVKDPKVVDRSAALIREGLALHQRVLTQLREFSVHYDVKDLKSHISKAILDAHLQDGSGGVFWHTITKDIVVSLKENLPKVLKRKS